MAFNPWRILKKQDLKTQMKIILHEVTYSVISIISITLTWNVYKPARRDMVFGPTNCSLSTNHGNVEFRKRL
jgi:hypothetical protein